MAKVEAKKAKYNDYQVIVSPRITEKATSAAERLAASGQCILFEVKKAATKEDIKGSVERLFNVEVKSVRTLNYQGKFKRTTKGVTQRAHTKRAYVTLKEGSKIAVVEGV